MSDPTNANGYPLGDDLRETLASALGLDVDEGWQTIAFTLMEQSVCDGPRVWRLPREPGVEVTAVRDEGGDVWLRRYGGWYLTDLEGAPHDWDVVMRYGPLTEVTEATS